jgi:hypothetical protein
MIQGVTSIHTSILQINVSQDVVKDMYQSTEHTVRYPTKEKHINEQGTTGRPVRLKRMPLKKKTFLTYNLKNMNGLVVLESK